MRSSLKNLIGSLVIFAAFENQTFAADMLYVANYNGKVGKYNTAGTTINSSFINSPLIAGPTDIALDKSGNIYTANWLNGDIVKSDPSGQNSSKYIDLNSSDRTIEFDSQGNLYTNHYVWPSGASSSTTTISQYDSSGTLINNQLISMPAGYREISDFSFDRNDNIYVVYSLPDGLGSQKSIISKYDNNGNLLNANYVTGLGPWTGEIVFDKLGNMLVVDWNIVYKYDTQGNRTGIFATNTGNQKGGVGMAIDSDDNIYLSNLHDGSISKFSSNGTLINQSFIYGLNQPRGIAIQQASVPEPSTYALAAIASGVMAALARRRKGLKSR